MRNPGADSTGDITSDLTDDNVSDPPAAPHGGGNLTGRDEPTPTSRGDSGAATVSPEPPAPGVSRAGPGGGPGGTRFARRGFARLAYEVTPATGEPPAVLVLHDLLATRASLAPWRDALLTAGASVIAPDLRGHGASAAIPGVRFTMAELVLDALAVLDAAPAPRVSILGVGLGGAIGLDLARVAPERVRCLLLIDPLLPGVRRDEPEFAVERQDAAAIADLANRGAADRAFDRYFGPTWRTSRPAPVVAAMRRHSAAFGTLLTAAYAYQPDLAALPATALLGATGEQGPTAALLAAGARLLPVTAGAEAPAAAAGFLLALTGT